MIKFLAQFPGSDKGSFQACKLTFLLYPHMAIVQRERERENKHAGVFSCKDTDPVGSGPHLYVFI